MPLSRMEEPQATADLWDTEGEATHAGGEGLVLVAVGVAWAGPSGRKQGPRSRRRSVPEPWPH